jgi:sulfur carrier protein
MKLRINGEPADVPGGQTLAQVLSSLGVEDPRGVAAAVDGEVVPRREWGIMVLREGQSIEVVRAVQGG